MQDNKNYPFTSHFIIPTHFTQKKTNYFLNINKTTKGHEKVSSTKYIKQMTATYEVTTKKNKDCN